MQWKRELAIRIDTTVVESTFTRQYFVVFLFEFLPFLFFLLTFHEQFCVALPLRSPAIIRQFFRSACVHRVWLSESWINDTLQQCLAVQNSGNKFATNLNGSFFLVVEQIRANYCIEKSLCSVNDVERWTQTVWVKRLIEQNPQNSMHKNSFVHVVICNKQCGCQILMTISDL